MGTVSLTFDVRFGKDKRAPKGTPTLTISSNAVYAAAGFSYRQYLILTGVLVPSAEPADAPPMYLAEAVEDYMSALLSRRPPS
jgi:hypothetical protein